MESIKRSVDSLQKIYAVIIALAITRVLLKVFDVITLEAVAKNFVSFLPELIAFFVIVVPFYHGMNRHLDRVYIEDKSKNTGALVIDFFIFNIEAGLLFLFANNIKLGLESFTIIALLLIVDILWAFTTHFIHYINNKPGTIGWAIINLVTVVVGFFIYIFNFIPEDMKSWSLAIILIVRTVVDYWKGWDFYFPSQKETEL